MSRKKILVPVDIQHDSAGLLRFAGNIALQVQGRISCVHIMPEQDLAKSNRNTPYTRRYVELELARATTETFTHIKPEFDIIVTQGDFSTRIIQMTEELGIDLVIIHVSDLVTLKTLNALINAPIMVYPEHDLKLRELTLLLNLDTKYYYKLQSSIDIATLLGMQLNLLAFTTSGMSEFRYKEKLTDIKSYIQKESIACTLRFIQSSNPGNIAQLVEDFPGEVFLFNFGEFESYLTDIKKGNKNRMPGITLLPANKIKSDYTPDINELILT